MKTAELKRGQKVTYQKRIRYKATVSMTAKVVAIFPAYCRLTGRTSKLLLDNGDELLLIDSKLYNLYKY